MEHFGAPTRLLDVTLSPYIAVFFALESGSGDCCVYAFNHQEIKISNKQVLGRETYREQQDLVFTDSEERFIVVFEPQSNNVRSLAQQGLFLVPSRIEQPFQNLLHEYLQFTDNDICLKFVIPARLRFEGFEILKRMNITSATLFPGIDGFCKSLRYQVLETTQSQKLLE